MEAGIDLRLTKQPEGFYDFTITEGRLDTVESFDTAILSTVFNERRASSSEVQAAANRRGWWGNLLDDTSGFEMGSKLWLLEQARRTNIQLNLAKTYASNAFQWLVEDGFAQNIEVQGELIREGFKITVTIKVNQDKVNTPLFDLWLNTGLNVSINIV